MSTRWQTFALLGFFLLAGCVIYSGDFSDRERTMLNGLVITGLWAIGSAIGLAKKLTTATYEDGGGVHHRSEDQTTYWYLVAFNVFGILLFVGIATAAIFHFS